MHTFPEARAKPVRPQPRTPLRSNASTLVVSVLTGFKVEVVIQVQIVEVLLIE